MPAGERLLSVLMPVRNEGMNAALMVKILHAVMDHPYEVLFVYDDPEDETRHAVEPLVGDYPVRMVLNERGRGVANAIQAGVEAAKGDVILIFAVDEVGPVLAIGDMLALIEEGCDLVSCTRYAYGGRRLGGAWVGGLLSRLANDMFRLSTGCPLTDMTTGIKMMRREVFSRFELESRPVGWAVAFELAIKAQLEGLVLGEVPIISIDRLYGGESTFKLDTWTVEYLRWFLWGVREIRRRPERVPRKSFVRIPRSTAV